MHSTACERVQRDGWAGGTGPRRGATPHAGVALFVDELVVFQCRFLVQWWSCVRLIFSV